MDNLKIFDSIESCTVGIKKENSFWFSAICDDDGFFTVRCEGRGGSESLIKLAKELMHIASK